MSCPMLISKTNIRKIDFMPHLHVMKGNDARSVCWMSSAFFCMCAYVVIDVVFKANL